MRKKKTQLEPEADLVLPEELIRTLLGPVDLEAAKNRLAALGDDRLRRTFRWAVRVVHTERVVRRLMLRDGKTPPPPSRPAEFGAALLAYTEGVRRGLKPDRMIAKVNRELVSGVREFAAEKVGKLVAIDSRR